MSQWKKEEWRAVLKYNFARGLTVDQCFEEMSPVLGDDCPHRSTIFRWFREFRRDNFDLEDAPRSGRPSSVVTEENVAAIRKLVEEDRRVSYRQIEESLGLYAPTIHTILHDHIRVRKLCSLWVPHSLTQEQMARRVSWCKQMLKKFESGASPYVNSIVTGDETWLYYYDVPTKSQNKKWVFEDEGAPVAVRKSRSVKKRMVAVFFTVRGVLQRVVLDSQKTVTGKWYAEECLPKVAEALKTIRPRSRPDSWFIHHDNAPAHRSRICTEYLTAAGFKVLDHPPYSPDLAPCDFALFPQVKTKLKGRRFATDEEVLQAWDDECAQLPEDTWKNWFDEWFRRMQRCIECDGNYFEKVK